jgi:hypothetical protein
MAEPPAQLNQKSDEPDIGKNVDDAPDVTQDIVVAPGIAQSNVAEPDIDQAYVAPDISVNTDNYFFNAGKYKVQDELIEWCKGETANAVFTIVIEKFDKIFYRRKPYFVLGCKIH